MSSERTLSVRPMTAKTEEKQAGGKPQSLQDAFLNLLRRNKTPVTMFLVKGVKLQGIVTWFDNFSILLRRDGQSQLVYKHAISTIMPGMQIDAAQFASQNSNAKQRLLQDVVAGDQSLFIRSDEVEACWRWADSLRELLQDQPVHTYPRKSWGPAAADALFGECEGRWVRE